MSANACAASSGNAGLPAALPADLLHGIALRPPELAWDGTRYRGSQLLGVRLAEVRTLAGVVATVQHMHFVGVVAVSPLYARQAAADLAPVWQAAHAVETPRSGPPDADQVRYGLRLPSVDPSPGSRVTAWSLNGHTSVWLPACTQAVQQILRRELAAVLQQPEATIRLMVVGADDALVDQLDAVHPLDLMDAAADAALLSQSVGRPVCVACHTEAADGLVLYVPQAADSIEPVPSPAAMAPGADGNQALTTVFAADAPWAMRPSLARLLSQPAQARAAAQPTVHSDVAVQAGKQASVPLRASVDELNAAQVFAQESLWHEQALARDEDPLAWRLQHLPEGQGRALAQRVVEQAGLPAADDEGAPRLGMLRGTGFATAQVQCVDESGTARTVWSAWVAEVTVQPQTGQVDVTRVVAGHDSQHLHPTQRAPILPEIEQQTPRLLANARRLLAGPRAFDDWSSPAINAADEQTGALSRREGAKDLSGVDSAEDGLVTQGQLGLDGVVTLPAAAAIANAIQDATGVRLRQVPFDSEQLRLALADRRRERTRNPLARGWVWLAAGMAGLAGMAAALWPMKPALPLTAGPDVSLYSMRAIERGRLVAAAGDCVACHTAPGGKANAGGLALDTPFGTIYTTNITPDNDTGIGRWSYTAFERAMRQGVHQDGRQLYPAFPYTAYAKLSDADMQALYGYLMSQPAVRAEPPKTQLAFPFNFRPLLAGWNALFHDATPFTPDPSRSAQWLRGAYLVQGASHCTACHSPRNRLGAEKTGEHYLAGGEAEGWTAPALNQLATGARGWTADELFQYLRTGYSPRHGVAAGPMAPVIHGLAELPDSDVKAITTYLLDLPQAAGATVAKQPADAMPAPTPVPAPASQSEARPAAQPVPAAATIQSLQGRRVNGERVYQNACAVCHEAGSGPTLFGVKPLLSSNTNLHAATPDNLIQVILNGIQTPANDELGYMPGFKDALDDRQIADLVGYLRERHAPGKDPWPDPTNTISRLREHAELN
ncbi:c-type cytochrome [Achromobacter marplatensis]|uniref:c-type cytochrome n=1 Tax=Achromobacter marplatensis TaxID=470868 RepID=UPI000277F83C|nr:cytochrome c [Achromobacter marplatensis]EJO33335.1 bifunctional protein,oxidoreductase/cytochrome subunit [Achromobacter marplatensis]